MNFTIEAMSRRDWKQVRDIYGEGLATGLAAFTEHPPKWDVWDAEHLTLGRLVARLPDRAIAGWAALVPVPNT